MIYYSSCDAGEIEIIENDFNRGERSYAGIDIGLSEYTCSRINVSNNRIHAVEGNTIRIISDIGEINIADNIMSRDDPNGVWSGVEISGTCASVTVVRNQLIRGMVLLRYSLGSFGSVNISDNSLCGMQMAGNCSDAVIERNQIIGNGVEISGEVSGPMLIENNNIIVTTEFSEWCSGIKKSGDVGAVTILNNVIESDLDAIQMSGVFHGDIIIEQNMITSSGRGINFDSSFGSEYSGFLTVHLNTIVADAGIYIWTGTTHYAGSVTENNITCVNGSVFISDLDHFSSLTVTDNSFVTNGGVRFDGLTGNAEVLRNRF